MRGNEDDTGRFPLLAVTFRILETITLTPGNAKITSNCYSETNGHFQWRNEPIIAYFVSLHLLTITSVDKSTYAWVDYVVDRRFYVGMIIGKNFLEEGHTRPLLSFACIV